MVDRGPQSLEANLPKPGILIRLSRLLYEIERRLMQASIGLLTLVIVAGILATALGSPFYWVNEASVSLMLFSTFLGQSMLTHTGSHPAVTLVASMLGNSTERRLERAANGLLLVLALFLIFLAFRLFDPVSVVRHEFDVMAFAIDEGNFVYQEPTNTLGIAKAWIWAAPVPTFFTFAIHALARMLASPSDLEDLGDIS